MDFGSHKNIKGEKRVLALEIRAQRFAFAVLEGAKLLDWGVRRTGRTEKAIALRKLRHLLDLYVPTQVIMRQARRMKNQSSDGAGSMLRHIRGESKIRQIQLIVVEREHIERIFEAHGCQAKHEIAQWLSNRFTEVRWILPRKRKAWDPEPHFLAVFDALAAAITFLDRSSNA